MKRFASVTLAGAACMLAGCQSEEEAVKVACDSPNHVDNQLPPDERGRALAAYIEKNVKNDEVLRILTSADPAVDKAKQLEAAATKAGVKECALAKLWSTPMPPMFAMPSASAFLMPPPSAFAPPPPPGPSGSAARAPDSVQVLGSIPVEVVQRVVQQHAPKFRTCYEEGVKRDKALEGIVRIRFVIEADGKVGQAEDVGSKMPDAKVTTCIIEGFKTLQFPKPEKGTAVVVYPIFLKRS